MVVFNAKKDIPTLQGRVALVTGGNAGIGAAYVEALAAHDPECIYLCARRIPAAQALIDKIHKQYPDANIVPLQLDLSSFESIKKCAAEFDAKSNRLDLLFLNAGIAGAAPSLTTEGFEAHFGVNHVGHTFFAQLLMPKLLATQKLPDSDVRVMVTTGIGAHKLAPKSGLELDMMKTTAESMNSMTRKLAQVYPQITTTSHHPGTVKSEIWQKADGISTIVSLLVKPVLWFTAVTLEEGSKSGLWTAVAKKDSIKNGGYYEPVGKYKERTKNSMSQKLTDELWDWTNKELAELDGPGWPEV